MEDIRSVLENPIEVRESLQQSFVELLFQVKPHPEGSPRFRLVVLKVLKNGVFISTAMTTNAIRGGRILYRKGERA